MRSLAGLRNQLAELLAARRALAAKPRTVVFIPRNGREPIGAPDGTYTTGSPHCRVVHYDVNNPPAELMTEPAPETDDPFRHYSNNPHEGT